MYGDSQISFQKNCGGRIGHVQVCDLASGQFCDCDDLLAHSHIQYKIWHSAWQELFSIKLISLSV